MKKHLLLPTTLLLLLFSSCVKEDQWTTSDPGSTDQRTKSSYELTAKDHVKIAVLTDIHYMHPSLLRNNAQNGTAYQKMLSVNPNKALLEYSVPIFSQTISELIQEHPDIVLIAGDLTKDGELIGHQAVADILKQLTQAGIKVYVTPGNNDINNKDAAGFDGNDSYKVPTITPADFRTYYKDFGYTSAIAADLHSLSYVAQPLPGLWILSIDAEIYDAPNEKNGRIRPETMQWLLEQLQAASDQHVMVLGLMHRNLIEHFNKQNDVLLNTVVQNWETTADALMNAGLQVLFTGHTHAIDMVMRAKGNKTLYEVETGSLVTPPSGYRIMTLKNKELDISTSVITSINAPLPEGQSFTEYSQATLTTFLDKFFTRYTSNPVSPLYLPVELREQAVPLIRNAYAAHMAGDEKLAPGEQARINAFEQTDPVATKNVLFALNTMWADLGVKDHKWHIKISNP